MKHCLVFASLISPSKMILFEKKYQTFDTVFHHQMKHLQVRQKYSAARRIFNSLLGVSSGDETLHLMFDILRQNSNVWKNEVRIPMFGIISKLQRVEGYGQNSNVWNDMVRIPMFKRITPKFQCLER